MKRVQIITVLFCLASLCLLRSSTSQEKKSDAAKSFKEGQRLLRKVADLQKKARELERKAHEAFRRSARMALSLTPADCPEKVLFVVGSGNRKVFCMQTKCCGTGVPHRGFGYHKMAVTGTCSNQTCNNPISGSNTNNRLEHFPASGPYTLRYHANNFFSQKINSSSVTKPDPCVQLVIRALDHIRVEESGSGTLIGNFLIVQFDYMMPGEASPRRFAQAFETDATVTFKPVKATRIKKSGSDQLELVDLEYVNNAIVIKNALLVKSK